MIGSYSCYVRIFMLRENIHATWESTEILIVFEFECSTFVEHLFSSARQSSFLSNRFLSSFSKLKTIHPFLTNCFAPQILFFSWLKKWLYFHRRFHRKWRQSSSQMVSTQNVWQQTVSFQIHCIMLYDSNTHTLVHPFYQTR